MSENLIPKIIEKKFILIIDEINRANLPSVLGELIYALEYRGENVNSMYDIDGDNTLIIPPNLYIIGTMNTADRSVGHIDYAIRRRFAFVEMLSLESVLDEVIKDEALRKKAKILFNDVANLFTPMYLAPDFSSKQVQLGHSYFLAETEEELKLKLEYEIKPILEEYLKDGILKDSAKGKVKELQLNG
ncbi:MAG: AAA family ATPase [Ignavibacteria bacterium]|nr:AAA family ATPase [Ignavibacteria bacterium]